MVSASEPKSPRPMGEGGAAIAAGVRSEQLPKHYVFFVSVVYFTRVNR